MLSKIYSATTIGINSYQVDVEVDISVGLMNFFIVGLPDTAIKESRQRIASALKNSGIRIPDKKITVNLAPANLKKEGTVFDLPIAVAILQAMNFLQLEKKFIDETLFLGELSLDGSLNYVKGIIPIAFDAQKLNKKRLVIPAGNDHEARLIPDIEVISVKNVIELISYLRYSRLPDISSKFEPHNYSCEKYDVDFVDVKGQESAKRALLISAAGRHNILFIGSPGSGKTMLSKRLPTIMPAMSFAELIETSKVYSVSGKLQNQSLITSRPFRNPHHTISQAGLVGGGTSPQPGEVSMAHNGILFLDELAEFKKSTLEVLRQPIENKDVTITRANSTVTFPADFLLVAATNPCPCGFYMDNKKTCSCSQIQISRYLEKLSGPMLDRIDIQVPILTIEYSTIKDKNGNGMSSSDMKLRVEGAVQLQRNRFGKLKFNSQMNSKEIEKFCLLTDTAEIILKRSFDILKLSMRGYHKILKISRTIADLDNSELIHDAHIKEAINYRSLDKLVKN